MKEELIGTYFTSARNFHNPICIKMLVEQMPERKKDIFMFLWLHDSQALYDLNLQRLFKDYIEMYGIVFLTKEEFFEINKEVGAPDEIFEELWGIIPLISSVTCREELEKKDNLRRSMRKMLAKRNKRLENAKQKKLTYNQSAQALSSR